jgi:hypothetical protein
MPAAGPAAGLWLLVSGYWSRAAGHWLLFFARWLASQAPDGPG